MTSRVGGRSEVALIFVSERDKDAIAPIFRMYIVMGKRGASGHGRDYCRDTLHRMIAALILLPKHECFAYLRTSGSRTPTTLAGFRASFLPLFSGPGSLAQGARCGGGSAEIIPAQVNKSLADR